MCTHSYWGHYAWQLFFTEYLFILPRKKKTSCHILSQGFKESRIQSLRDSRTQALKESRIQAFKDSKAHGWKDSAIHVGAFVPRTTASDFPNSIFGSPQSKAYEDICSKALKCKRKSGQVSGWACWQMPTDTKKIDMFNKWPAKQQYFWLFDEGTQRMTATNKIHL